MAILEIRKLNPRKSELLTALIAISAIGRLVTRPVRLEIRSSFATLAAAALPPPIALS